MYSEDKGKAPPPPPASKHSLDRDGPHRPFQLNVGLPGVESHHLGAPGREVLVQLLHHLGLPDKRHMQVLFIICLASICSPFY